MNFTQLWPVVVVLALGCHTSVSAQERQSFDAGAGVAVATLSELASHEVGASARFGWRPWEGGEANALVLGFEAETVFYPADLPHRHAVTGSRTELALGVTAGPRLGRLRPFGRVRPGILRTAAAPQPVACILIFPPPLSCTLAGGRSLFMLDVGGGIEFDASRRTFLRVDVGDRLVRYPGPAIAEAGTVHDGAFSGHDPRVAMGVGWRF